MRSTTTATADAPAPLPPTPQNIMRTRPDKICRQHHGFWTKNARAAAAVLTAMLATALPAAGPDQSGKNLGDLSIEELMNESVTSVSGHEQRLGDAAAAIAVLSNDDLRRSGAATIMEALRLVPGMEVGAVNSSQMAVSARGFNGVFSNKLLVLVDGRAVYNPLFSGVYWDLQQTIMEDVDRVEVIRGPGATIWGANAVNGVVSVVTRSARDTQGTLVYGGGGDVYQALGGVRYGGRAGENTYFRTFVSYQATADYPLANGHPAGDQWQSTHGGFRLDHYPDQDTQLTWQAEATTVDLYDHTADANNINTLGRWTRQLSAESSVEVQAYYDRTSRNDAANIYAVVDTADVTAQHTLTFDPQNAVIWGLGYRFTNTVLKPAPPLIIMRKSHVRLHLFNMFVQDELKVVPDKVTLTAGIKVEHNDFTGFEFQPSVRATFKPAAQQTLWAAVSRAVRTPSETEGRDMFTALAGPPFGRAGWRSIRPDVGRRRPSRRRSVVGLRTGLSFPAGPPRKCGPGCFLQRLHKPDQCQRRESVHPRRAVRRGDDAVFQYLQRPDLRRRGLGDVLSRGRMEGYRRLFAPVRPHSRAGGRQPRGAGRQFPQIPGQPAVRLRLYEAREFRRPAPLRKRHPIRACLSDRRRPALLSTDAPTRVGARGPKPVRPPAPRAAYATHHRHH
jgi:outer membrane receptor protein involved in Fe transport